MDTFIVTAPSTMHAVTFGFGGGTSGTGAIVAPGGFGPYLSLFDPGGNFIASTFDPSTLCPAGANLFNGNCFDVRLDGGQVPNVDVFVASGSSFTALASISGYMIDLP